MRESLGSAPLRVSAASAKETEAFGARLARSMPPWREHQVVVFLEGDLGAGKTTLARGFLHAAGVSGTVRSPSYTLLETYEVPGAHARVAADVIIHLDLYRLQEPAELESLGLRDLARPGFVWLVEWPERGEGLLPAVDLRVRLSVAESAHDIESSAFSPLGEAWLARLRA